MRHRWPLSPQPGHTHSLFFSSGSMLPHSECLLYVSPANTPAIMTLTPVSLPLGPDITFGPVTSSFLLSEVCRDQQRDDRMLVNTLSPKQTLVPQLWGLPVSMVKDSQSGQTAPRRLTRPQAGEAGGDGHSCPPGARTTCCRTSLRSWVEGPVGGALLISSQKLSPWKPEKLPPSLCLLSALRCWIWTSQYEINTPPQTLP